MPIRRRYFIAVEVVSASAFCTVDLFRNPSGSIFTEDPLIFAPPESPEGRIGVSRYTGEGCQLGGIIDHRNPLTPHHS